MLFDLRKIQQYSGSQTGFRGLDSRFSNNHCRDMTQQPSFPQNRPVARLHLSCLLTRDEIDELYSPILASEPLSTPAPCTSIPASVTVWPFERECRCTPYDQRVLSTRLHASVERRAGFQRREHHERHVLSSHRLAANFSADQTGRILSTGHRCSPYDQSAASIQLRAYVQHQTGSHWHEHNARHVVSSHRATVTDFWTNPKP
jgi:hypothetical protein